MFAPFKALLSRRIFALVLAVLMVVTAGVFSVMFISLQCASRDLFSKNLFTTSAIPDRPSNGLDSAENGADRNSYVSEAIASAAQSKSVKFIDNRTLVLGYCKNLTPAYDKDMHRFDSLSESDDSLIHGAVFYNATYPNDIGLYELICTEAHFETELITFGYESEPMQRQVYYSSWEFVASIYKSAYHQTSPISYDFDAPSVLFNFLSRDEYPSAGDHCLFWGKFYDKTDRISGVNRFLHGAPIYSSELSAYPDYPDYPCFIKLPDGLTAEEYLATEEGKEKFGDVIEMFEKNIHSVPVVLTDSLMSMYNFSAGITPIKEGRAFTDEEYASGAQVCVISTALAKANDLKVGDRLEFQFYNRGKLYAEDTRLATDTELYAPYFNGITPITDTMEYEIVGICKNDKFLFGEHDFTPNTVFIPSASMTDEAVRENLNADWEPMSTKLTSVIIENGKLYEFREEMESLGYGDCFLYSDENGMTDVFLAAVERENRIKPIFCASAIVFAVVALICTVLAGVMIKRTDEYKEILAQSRAKAYFAAVLSTFTFSACALLLGVIASYFLFDTVAALLIGANTGVDFSLISALKALGLEAAVTAVGSAIGGIGGKK